MAVTSRGIKKGPFGPHFCWVSLAGARLAFALSLASWTSSDVIGTPVSKLMKGMSAGGQARK